MVSLTWATFEVTDTDSAAEVLTRLLTADGPVALDTETTGCNPKKQGPVQLAKAWCMTLAWRTPVGIEAAFIPSDQLHHFRGWLESEFFHKVGQNVFGYDRHVLLNEGIHLRGIVADTQRMSRLLNPAKAGVHGLKAMAAALGMPMRSFEDVTGGCVIDDPEITEEMRAAVRSYAVRDAVATLQVYENLASTLGEVRW